MFLRQIILVVQDHQKLMRHQIDFQKQLSELYRRSNILQDWMMSPFRLVPLQVLQDNSVNINTIQEIVSEHPSDDDPWSVHLLELLDQSIGAHFSHFDFPHWEMLHPQLPRTPPEEQIEVEDPDTVPTPEYGWSYSIPSGTSTTRGRWWYSITLTSMESTGTYSSYFWRWLKTSFRSTWCSEYHLKLPHLQVFHTHQDGKQFHPMKLNIVNYRRCWNRLQKGNQSPVAESPKSLLQRPLLPKRRRKNHNDFNRQLFRALQKIPMNSSALLFDDLSRPEMMLNCLLLPTFLWSRLLVLSFLMFKRTPFQFDDFFSFFIALLAQSTTDSF